MLGALGGQVRARAPEDGPGAGKRPLGEEEPREEGHQLEGDLACPRSDTARSPAWGQPGLQGGSGCWQSALLTLCACGPVPEPGTRLAHTLQCPASGLHVC